LNSIATSGNETISAGVFVFACGPWRPKVFPELLGRLIQPERAEVYFLGVAPGDAQFSQMPIWIFKCKDVEAYGMPVLENRGFKVAVDKLSLPADPDTMDREPSPYRAQLRAFRCRALSCLDGCAGDRDARVPVREYRTRKLPRRPSPGDGEGVGRGGSGHGFKNGPAMGEYVASVMAHGAPLE
jgi:sarcosine oxidase